MCNFVHAYTYKVDFPEIRQFKNNLKMCFTRPS